MLPLFTHFVASVPPNTQVFLAFVVVAFLFNVALLDNRLYAALNLQPNRPEDVWRIFTSPLVPRRSLFAFLLAIYQAPSSIGKWDALPHILLLRSVLINFFTLVVFQAWLYVAPVVAADPTREAWCGLLPLILACQVASLSFTDMSGAAQRDVALLPFTVSPMQEPFAWALVYAAVGGGDVDLVVALLCGLFELQLRGRFPHLLAPAASSASAST
jgi:hypothetical protein